MQGKELGQHQNAAWAGTSEQSAHTTEELHAKNKGKEQIPSW